MTTRPELPLFLLALVAVIGSVVLIALGHDVPAFLQSAVLAAVAAGAGLAVPRTPIAVVTAVAPPVAVPAQSTPPVAPSTSFR